MLQRVRLRRAGELAARALGRHVEGVARDALDAAPREDPGLLGDFVWRADVHPAAEAAVLPLGVLAHADHVDVLASCARPAAIVTPGSSRIGRRFTYWSKRWRSGRISSHTDT